MACSNSKARAPVTFSRCGQRHQPQLHVGSLGMGTGVGLQGSHGACQLPEKFRCHPAPSQQAAAFPGRELYF